MNGLFYCDWFEEYTAALAKSVAESHRVTLIVRESSSEFRGRREDEAQLHRELVQAGIDLRVLPGKYSSVRSLFNIYKIRNNKRKNGYDYFHIQLTDDPRFLWLALRIPTVCTVHEPGARQDLHNEFPLLNRGEVIRRLYRYLARRIVVHTQGGLAGLSPREARKAVVIPHGVHASVFKESIGSKTILFFGRVSAYKGLSTLLAAMERVWKVEPQARLQILASPVTPGEADCRYDVSDSRISATWGGYSKSDLEHALANACAICLPYTSASGSGVGAQAYGSGKPIVASNIEGLRALVAHEELLVQPGDVDDLARALSLVLSRDYGVQEIDAARTWPKVALAHIAAYQSVVNDDERELQSKS
jgi:glycosyltransferase involved in cell wall biosynthesis